MASPNDNAQLTDGHDALYRLRSQDTSPSSDGSLQTVRHFSTPYPIEYGARGGAFQLVSRSGVMAAGLNATAPIYAFRWTSQDMLCVLRRIQMSVWTNTVGFAAGVAIFYVLRCQAWTVSDTSGVTDTLSQGNANLRTSMPSTAVGDLRHASTATIVGGIRVIDTQPFDYLVLNAAQTASTMICSRTPLFDKTGPADHPLVLATNEGFLIRAIVPATGTWSFAITPEWDEVPLVNY